MDVMNRFWVKTCANAVRRVGTIARGVADIRGVRTLCVFLFFAAFFSLTYLTVDRVVSLDDPLFHIRFAETVRERGLSTFRDFDGLPFSEIGKSYLIYYNFLFYAALIPFTFFHPLIMGIKVYGVLSAAATLTVSYLFLRTFSVPKPFFWVLGLASAISPFDLVRFIMARPFSLAPALLMLIILAGYRKRYALLASLSVAYFLWHTATFFFPIFCIVILSAFGGLYGRKVDLKLLLSTIFGTALGFVIVSLIAPGFPTYMREIIFGVFADTIVGKKVAIAEGGELYPVKIFDYLSMNMVLFGGFLIGISLEISRYVGMRRERSLTVQPDRQVVEGALFAISLSFFLFSLISRRNLDFFVIAVMAYIPMGLVHFSEGIRALGPISKRALVAGVAIFVVYLVSATGLTINDRIASMQPYDFLERPSEWLKNNVKSGEIVFNTTWNWFPSLYLYNPGNRYIAGIEPRFLYNYDPEKYWEWWHISGGGYVCRSERCDQMELRQQAVVASDDEEVKKTWAKENENEVADAIRNDFSSSYIVTSDDFSALSIILGKGARFEEVYRDPINRKMRIYRIRD
ncbi:MAG: hypothetical protein HGB37_02110 [Candidatus Moranbacteria bacterium]|nr:hypothetical protein [Candidatus Moranbacteria bacterium]